MRLSTLTAVLAITLTVAVSGVTHAQTAPPPRPDADVAAIGLAVFLQTRLDRELSELPVPERRAIYERTLETLRTTCTQARGLEVAEYCRRQADFIKRFPECESDCRDLAARFAPQPSH